MLRRRSEGSDLPRTAGSVGGSLLPSRPGGASSRPAKDRPGDGSSAVTIDIEGPGSSTDKGSEELTDLLRPVDLSAPSSTKFDPVRIWLAARAGLEARRVVVYWVSKPGNFDVRFRQPGVVRDRPVLGFALVPSDESLDGYKRPARRLVEAGEFQAMVVCTVRDGVWLCEAAFLRSGSDVDATVGGLVPADAILRVGTQLEGGIGPDAPRVDRTTTMEKPSFDWEEAADDLKPEGLDDRKISAGWGEYPLDSVFVRTETRTVGEVVRRIQAGRYQLDPEFQRDFVWSPTKQSRLIESCTMRIPLPVFYVAEMKDGRIAVVDGLQRLTTFSRFLGGDLALTGLDDPDSPHRHPLSGKKFADLPLSLAERVEDTQLTLYILDVKAPDRAKLDIFERVNSGVPLSRQQMRNSLYNGPATRWLKEAASDPAFLEATGRSLDPKSMRDREAINRFCAFYDTGRDDYHGGDMDAFLGRALERLNEASDERRAFLMDAFRQSMRLNSDLFGRHAFRKSLAETEPDAYRTVVNIALFDVCSVLFAEASPASIEARRDEIRAAFRSLVQDEQFKHAITYSTNSTRQVRMRFELAASAMRGLA